MTAEPTPVPTLPAEPTPAPAPLELPSAKVGTVQRTDESHMTELRARPDEEAPGNGVLLSNGEPIVILAEAGVWFQVASGRRKGFMKQAYVVC